MTERAHLAGELETARPQEAARDSRDLAAPTAAVIGGWTGLGVAGSRGSGPALGRAIGNLQATAGNGAVAQLLATASSTRPARHPAVRSVAARAEGTAGPAVGPGTVTAQRAGAPTPGPSWTKVGPPTPSTFAVSGTLRQAATALAARKEAGATISGPSVLDTETWAPPDGEERITAARFEVPLLVELPTWTDKGAATRNQQAEWDRFHGAIAAHEAGHVAKDRTVYANAHTKALRKTPAQGDELKAKLDAQSDKDNKAFDSATNHGQNTGTIINANIDEVTKVP